MISMRRVENYIKVFDVDSSFNLMFFPHELMIIFDIKGSETERQRIRASYLSCHGKINSILADIPFAWATDRERISLIIDGDLL